MADTANTDQSAQPPAGTPDPPVSRVAPLGEPVPTEAGAGAPPAAPAGPPPPEGAPPAEETISMPSSAFKDRLRREANQMVANEYGGLTPAQVKDLQSKLEAAQKAEEEAARAKMDENERLKHDLAKAQQERDAAFEERDAARIEHQISSTCAQLGITNVGYATHLLAEHAEGLGDGDEFDEEEVLKQIMEDPRQKSALGIAAEPTKVDAPATTALTGDGAPKPPNAGANGNATPNAFDMTDEQWRKHKQSLGLI